MPDIPHSEHTVTDDSLALGTSVTYECQTGYTMSGNGMLFCEHERTTNQLQWLGDYPRCMLSGSGSSGKCVIEIAVHGLAL